MDKETITLFCEQNVIIADADYIDSVAFDLTVNFERMLERRLPPADLARWAECIALDGGVREGCGNTQVVLLHDKDRRGMEYFAPGNYADDIHGKAFQSNLGEFSLTAVSTEGLVGKDDLLVDIVRTVCTDQQVKRVMVIPGEGTVYTRLRQTLQQVDDEKRITLFAMQPMQGGNYRQEILGYALMNALGIRGEELQDI